MLRFSQVLAFTTCRPLAQPSGDEQRLAFIATLNQTLQAFVKKCWMQHRLQANVHAGEQQRGEVDDALNTMSTRKVVAPYKGIDATEASFFTLDLATAYDLSVEQQGEPDPARATYIQMADAVQQGKPKLWVASLNYGLDCHPGDDAATSPAEVKTMMANLHVAAAGSGTYAVALFGHEDMLHDYKDVVAKSAPTLLCGDMESLVHVKSNYAVVRLDTHR